MHYTKLKRNKRGTLSDFPFILAGIFSVVLVALLVAMLVNNINSEIQDIDVFPDTAKDASRDMSNDFPHVIDGGIIFLFFSMVVISLVLASLVPVHPVFLIFYLFELIVLIYLGAGISNAYELIIDNATFAVQKDQFILSTFLFKYLPFVVALLGALLAVVVYKTKEKFAG